MHESNEFPKILPRIMLRKISGNVPAKCKWILCTKSESMRNYEIRNESNFSVKNVERNLEQPQKFYAIEFVDKQMPFHDCLILEPNLQDNFQSDLACDFN